MADSSVEDDADLKRLVAISFERIGDVLIELDHTADALRAYDVSLRLFESDRTRAALSNDFAAVNQKLGRVLGRVEDRTTALSYFIRSSQVSTQLANDNAARIDLQLEALRSRIALAGALATVGKKSAALQ